MVDYSKWDHLDFSDDDDDDNHHAQPRVTSLDSPGRVKIGADGTLEIESAGSTTSRPTATSDGSTTLSERNGKARENTSDSTSSSLIHSEQSKKKLKLEKWKDDLTRNGGYHNITVTFDTATENSTETSLSLPIYWSQDRYALTLRLAFPPSLFHPKSIRMRVQGALEYKDRFAAVGSGSMSGYKKDNETFGAAAFGSLEIVAQVNHASLVEENTSKSVEIVLLNGKLPRPIYLNQDENEIEFEIEDNQLYASNESTVSNSEKFPCTKFVKVTLPKAVPMEGMIIWWDNPLLGFPKINVSSIAERSNPMKEIMSVEEYNTSMDTCSRVEKTSKKEEFQKVWEDAHALFRAKVKSKEVQELDVGD